STQLFVRNLNTHVGCSIFFIDESILPSIETKKLLDFALLERTICWDVIMVDLIRTVVERPEWIILTSSIPR
uniref:AAA_5 domain-containing protein n=1 Tax=Mesocestoides corti TaxID=53468 RepID=A0A5K3ENL6_MESCO